MITPIFASDISPADISEFYVVTGVTFAFTEELPSVYFGFSRPVVVRQDALSAADLPDISGFEVQKDFSDVLGKGIETYIVYRIDNEEVNATHLDSSALVGVGLSILTVLLHKENKEIPVMGLF